MPAVRMQRMLRESSAAESSAAPLSLHQVHPAWWASLLVPDSAIEEPDI